MIRSRSEALGWLVVAMLAALALTVVLWIALVGFGGIAGVLLLNRGLNPLIPFGMAVAFLLPPITATGLVISRSARELRETLLIAGVIAWIAVVILPLTLLFGIMTAQGSMRWPMPS